jgi:hypothetical protein
LPEFGVEVVSLALPFWLVVIEVEGAVSAEAAVALEIRAERRGATGVTVASEVDEPAWLARSVLRDLRAREVGALVVVVEDEVSGTST